MIEVPVAIAPTMNSTDKMTLHNDFLVFDVSPYKSCVYLFEQRALYCTEGVIKIVLVDVRLRVWSAGS